MANASCNNKIFYYRPKEPPYNRPNPPPPICDESLDTAITEYKNEVENVVDVYTESDSLLVFTFNNLVKERRMLFVRDRNTCPFGAFAACLSAHSGKLVLPSFLIEVGLEWITDYNNFDRMVCIQSQGGGWSGNIPFKEYVESLISEKDRKGDDCFQYLQILAKNAKRICCYGELFPYLCVAWSVLWRKIFKIYEFQEVDELIQSTIYHPAESMYSNANSTGLRKEHYTIVHDVDNDLFFGECGVENFLEIWSNGK
jgi:hypothetical protein